MTAGRAGQRKAPRLRWSIKGAPLEQQVQEWAPDRGLEFQKVCQTCGGLGCELFRSAEQVVHLILGND